MDALIHALAATRDDEVADVVVLMAQAIRSSVESILKLTESLDLPIRDAFGIARSVVEQAANVTYIAVVGPEAARRAQMHALQRGYRDLDRKLRIGDAEIRVSADRPALTPERFPEIQEALDAFTKKNGTEIRDWTTVSLARRIETISGKHRSAGLKLHAAYFAIYAHSSEILHGSYFGSIFFWGGMGRTPQSRDEFKYLALTSHLITVFMAAYFSVHAMVDVLCENYRFSDLGETSSGHLQSISDYLENDLANVSPPPR